MKLYYVKSKTSWLTQNYKASDPGRTLLIENAGKFTLAQAEKALKFCESFEQRKGVFRIVEIN